MPRKTPPKTRNGGQWTEARFFSFIRSALRRASVKWGPIQQAAVAARRKSQSDNKRLKWEFQCSQCKEWLPRKEVEVNHKVPAGSLKSFDDLPGFCERLFVEVDGLEVLCKRCHNVKTKKQRAAK